MKLMNILFTDRSLGYKFLILSIVPVIIVVVFIFLNILASQEKMLIEETEAKARLVTKLSILTVSNAFVIYNKELLDNVVDNLSQDPQIIYAVIIDSSDNRILAHSDHGRDGELIDTSLENIPLEFGGLASFSERTDKKARVYELAGDINISGTTYGVLKIAFSLKSAYQEIEQKKQRTLFIAAIALFLGAVLSIILARVISAPIKALVEQTKIIGSGNFEQKIVYKSKDILGQLADAFNEMVSDLKIKQQKIIDSEARLQQAQKMESIGTLAGGIAHDFNNILSGIFGYSHLAQVNIDQPEKALRHIDQILKGAKRAADLVQQILTFSRQTEYQMHPFIISMEVNDALKLIRSSIPSTIEIIKNIDSKSMVLADPIKIHQLVMNLCTNAYHAMRKTGGRLTVSLTDIDFSQPKELEGKEILPGQYVRLEVRDTGMGMDKKTLKKAFDPYYTTKGLGHGTGLGLALVKAIVDEHDGFLAVDSTPEKGTCFHVYFPIIKDEVKHRIPQVKRESLLMGDETVMVVDDEEAIRQSCGALFIQYGYQVRLFENGRAALEAFKKESSQFDLIITDMTMPGLTGDKLAEEVLKIKPDMPIILCSGFSDIMSEARAAEIGIRKYVQKPIENRDLMILVRELFDEKDSV